MKAFSTLGCPELELPEVLALAARHRIDAVELRTLAGTLDLPAHFAARYGLPARLAAFVHAQPVRIVALDTSLRLAGGTEQDRQACLAFVPWAEALGVKWLRVFDGGGNTEPATLAAVAASFAWWQRTRAESGWQVDLMIETHDSLLTTMAIREFLGLAPDARLLWDAHNTWRHGAGDLAAMWTAIRDAVVHVHVKDSVSRPVLHYDHTYVLPGDGEFPLRPLLAALARDRFTGALSLEWERQWHPYLPPLEEALEAAERRRWW